MKDKELKKKKISNKMKAAANEYVKDWNLYRALISAGYSENYAKAQGYKMLENVGFKDYIEEIQKDIAKLAGISMLSQVLRLKNIADGNIATFYEDWSKLKDFESLSDEEKKTLLEISYKKDMIKIDGVPTDMETEFVKLKINNPIEAIKEINKILGYYAAEKKDVTTGGEKLNSKFYFTADDFED